MFEKRRWRVVHFCLHGSGSTFPMRVRIQPTKTMRIRIHNTGFFLMIFVDDEDRAREARKRRNYDLLLERRNTREGELSCYYTYYTYYTYFIVLHVVSFRFLTVSKFCLSLLSTRTRDKHPGSATMLEMLRIRWRNK
jgi:hypothetical protein